jgi:hypothetical protein
MEGEILFVSLTEGAVIQIPNLPRALIDSIFAAHSAYLERHAAIKDKPESDHFPFRIGFSSMDGIATAMQHNPAQADGPDIPREILEKIGGITKILAPEELAGLPQPEPNCNCMHCQIVRGIHESLNNALLPAPEELVTAEELHFPEWDIKQIDDKLYSVSPRLEPEKKYQVFLGEPLGCTCGQSNCEHILAVLKS